MVGFGIGAGDFVAVGTLCWKLYKKCKDSPGAYKELASEVSNLRSVIEELQELLGQQSLDDAQLARLQPCKLGCETVLKDLDVLLDKYESLGTKSQKTFDRMGMAKQDLNGIRSRLISNVAMLEAFITIFSHAKLERKLNLLIIEVRTGQREGSVISTIGLDVPAESHWETWNVLEKELEDVGVSHETIVEKRAFIVEWFRDAVAAEKLEEDEPSEDDGNLHTNLGDSGNISQETPLLSSGSERSSERHLAHVHGMDTSDVEQAGCEGGRSSRTVTTAKIQSAQTKQVGSSVFKELKKQAPSMSKASYVLGKLLGKDRALLEATRFGDELGARFWLGQGARVREMGEYRMTALHHAAVAGNRTVLQLLIDHGANLDAQNHAGKTAVHYAVEAQEKAILQLLLDNGAKIEEKDVSGHTPLASAMLVTRATSKRGQDLHLETTRVLLRCGADPGSVWVRGKSILALAIQLASDTLSTATVRALLEHGVDAKTTSSKGSPLSLASRRGKVEVVELLLDHGAEIDGTSDDDNYRTPLWWALHSGHLEVVELLLERKVDVTARTRNGETLLFPAIRSERSGIQIVTELLERGVDIEAEDAHGDTALMKATRRGHGAVETVQLLLANGANIEARSSRRETPLLRAVKSPKGYRADYRADVVLLLLQNGADLRAKDIDGNDALSRALQTSPAPFLTFPGESFTNLKCKARERHDALLILLHFATFAETEHVRRKFLDDCQHMGPLIAAERLQEGADFSFLHSS
ncbi:MAG: hypothetical protein Q9207_005885 [Kuettlingeria erythrocarpa]